MKQNMIQYQLPPKGPVSRTTGVGLRKAYVEGGLMVQDTELGGLLRLVGVGSGSSFTA